MSSLTFAGQLERPEGTGTWTYVRIPFDAAAHFGARGQVKVRCTIDGQPYRGSLMPRGDGTHFLVVNKTVRDAIGKTAGDPVTVSVEPDSGPRSLTVPPDLERALTDRAPARAVFEAFSYSHRKAYIEWIEGAKKEETRTRRIAKALEMLAEGRPFKM